MEGAVSTKTATSGQVATNGTQFVEQARAALIKIRNDLMAEMGQAMADALQAGEEAGKTRIESATTPTGEKRAATGGYAGRIDSHAYIDELQHHTYQVDTDHLQGRIGWLDGADNQNNTAVPFKVKSYIELQESGFVANGTAVPAVHALLDSTQVAKTEFRKALTEYVRREFE